MILASLISYWLIKYNAALQRWHNGCYTNRPSRKPNRFWEGNIDIWFCLCVYFMQSVIIHIWLAVNEDNCKNTKLTFYFIELFFYFMLDIFAVFCYDLIPIWQQNIP